MFSSVNFSEEYRRTPYMHKSQPNITFSRFQILETWSITLLNIINNGLRKQIEQKKQIKKLSQTLQIQNQETNEDDNLFRDKRNQSLQLTGDETWANQESVATRNFQSAKDQPTKKERTGTNEGRRIFSTSWAFKSVHLLWAFYFGLTNSSSNQTKPVSNVKSMAQTKPG